MGKETFEYEELEISNSLNGIMMKKINLEEILSEIFEPVSQDCSTPAQDLQLAITLNPDVGKIKQAMREACRQILELTTKNGKVERIVTGRTHTLTGGYNEFGYVIDRESVINLINQLE